MIAIACRARTAARLFACAFCALPLGPSLANQMVGDVQPSSAMDSQSIKPGEGLGFFNNPSYLVVPIPISNPTIGSGLALAGAMFFKTDEQSSSSLVGLGTFYTSNGSKGLGGMTDVSFDQDIYRVKASGGYASVNYDFYGVGNAAGSSGRFVPINQAGNLFQLLFVGRVAPHFYVGGQMRSISIRTGFKLPDVAGEILDNGGPLSKLDTNISTLGVAAIYDSRNKDYSPTGGSLVDADFDIGIHSLIASNDYMRTTVSYSRYDELADGLVLASHASLCGTGGNVPIFELCLMGSNNDIRGYGVGQYQDKAMFTEQEELRVHVFWRFGFVAFAGLGSVAPSIDKFSKILGAGGVGVRFLASEDYGVNIGIDAAVNAAGKSTYYIQVGEAF
jgi:outer membrane protein assembly factor BamA